MSKKQISYGKGIKPTSAAKVVKHGASEVKVVLKTREVVDKKTGKTKKIHEKIRVSHKAVESAIEQVEAHIQEFAKAALRQMNTMKLKTLSGNVLQATIDNMGCVHGQKGMLKALANARADSKSNKVERKDIAIESVVRVVRRELGKGPRISGTAGYFFSDWASMCLRKFGKHGFAVAVNAGRHTLQAKDIKVVVGMK